MLQKVAKPFNQAADHEIHTAAEKCDCVKPIEVMMNPDLVSNKKV